MKVNIEERVAIARELFTSGYNCAQSVFIAYKDLADMDEQTAATISAPFGGGMGRLREVCGAVSGMTMCAGYIAPNTYPNDNINKKFNEINYQDAKEDVISFIEDKESLTLWSSEFFIDISKNLHE